MAVRSQNTPGLYGDGGGLYLQVTPGGAKTWIYRFQLAGKRRGAAASLSARASTLETYVYPSFGSLPVNAVDTGLVMKVLEPIWSTKTETAN